jgi:hypothetical protein
MGVKRGMLATRWALWAALCLSLMWGVTASDCGGGGQFRQAGEEMGQLVGEGTVPGSYMYVADVQTKLYWPNRKKYADAIPSDRRVYIKDAETLKEFKGYKAGPL